MRKAIQIQEVSGSEYSGPYLVALCDDGTIWCFSGGAWSLMKEQIPQGYIVDLLTQGYSNNE
jgi:hypothetical protein